MHCIRLRGPWQLEPLARYVQRPGGYDRQEVDLPAEGTAKMPADWCAVCGQGFLGVVRCRRNFQKPTGLEPEDRVWLVVEAPRSRATVHLSRQTLGETCYGGPPARFDVTRLLDDRNRLEIVVEHPALDDSGVPTGPFQSDEPGGLMGEVRLEIEERAGCREQGAGS